jgi:hypothetical protein
MSNSSISLDCSYSANPAEAGTGIRSCAARGVGFTSARTRSWIGSYAASYAAPTTSTASIALVAAWVTDPATSRVNGASSLCLSRSTQLRHLEHELWQFCHQMDRKVWLLRLQ